MKKIADPEPHITPNRVGAAPLPDGRELGWAEYGEPDADPVLWFPGTPGARAQLPADALEEANARRLRVIVVERPGTGHSTPHTYTSIAGFVPDVDSLTDHLGIDQFAAIGLSGGGPFVLAVAAGLGDRMTTGVVLGGIGPTRGPDVVLSYTLALVPIAAALERVAEPLGNGLGRLIRTFAPAGRPFLDAFFWLERGDREAMAANSGHGQQLLHDLVDAARRSGMASPVSDLILFGRHWGFDLSEIDVPITFWGGTSDMIVPYHHATRQARRVADSEVRTAQGRGHFAGYTEVDEVFDVVREHWPAVRPAAPRQKRTQAGAGR